MVSSKDIIREFPHCEYHINTSVDYLPEQIRQWTTEDVFTVEIEPDFQRSHVWTEEQQIRFMEFLVRNPNDSKAKSLFFNCRNWRIDYEEENGNVIYLVDGLQRLTAIKRFLNNEIPIYGYYYKEFDSNLFIRRIYLDIYFNTLNRKEMLQWYIDLNSGGTVHTADEINKVQNLLEKECN